MKKRRTRQLDKQTIQPPSPVRTADAFMNALARMGLNQPNLLEGTEYPLTRLTRNYNLMNSLYRSHWVIRRIIDTIPEDMTKAWYELTTNVSPGLLDRFKKMERRTRTKARILEGLKWGRLYGGAAAIIVIDGHEGILTEELDYDTIMPGSYKGLMIFDRWSGISPGPDLVEDINDPDFGLPNMYQVTTQEGIVFHVHHSRVLRFIGRDVPFWEKQAEMHWSASEVEIVFDELKKRDNTSWNIANLVVLANLRVLKMADLGQALTIANGQVQQDLYNTLQAQNWLMSNMGMYVMDKDDEFDTKQYNFSGINDIYESFMLDLAGACEIPATKLFGRAPAGMNATGESDLQNYYDVIDKNQEAHLRPVLDKLLPIMALSEWGAIPDDLDYTFNPIHTPSDKELAELVEKKTGTIVEVFNAGLISQKVALKELKQMSDTTGIFSNITDEDIEMADQFTTLPGEDLLNSLSGFPNRQSSNSLTTDGDFRESAHPRDKDGKFSTTSQTSETGANKFAKGFGYNNLKVHINKHLSKYPGMTEKQYAQRALDLIQQPVGGDVHGHVNGSGQIIRYDAKSNDFVKGHPDIGIATMFRPADGMDYYLRQKKRDKKD